jgi:hypothetical protein
MLYPVTERLTSKNRAEQRKAYTVRKAERASHGKWMHKGRKAGCMYLA